jgi:alcohol dehydrogenase class IV
MKLCVWHPDLKPSLALLDPEITLGLPSSLTAWTGIDAMVHAIEAYCVPNFHPMCDGAALQALELIGQWLPVVCADPGDVRARGGMQVGACLAGVAFRKGLGLVHAMSHAVGAEYDTHHGLTNAVLLPAVLRFNAPAIAHKIPAMASALAIQATDFLSFYHWVCDLLDKLEIPARLCDLGVPEDATARLAAKALSDTAASTNPRALNVAAVEAVLLDAITIGR